MKFILLTVFTLLPLASAQTKEASISTVQAWGYAILSGFGLSVLGVVSAVSIVYLRRFITEETFKRMINLLYGLGCGAIIGDAMIHILPEAYQNEKANKNIVSLTFIFAICTFLIIQRTFVWFGIVHTHWGDDQHSSCGGHEYQQPQEDNIQKQLNQKMIADKPNNSNLIEMNYLAAQKPAQNKEPSQGQNESLDGWRKWIHDLKGKKSSGYLIFVSSLIHNFFDGFAIGVGFASRQRQQYIPVVVAIFAHEIPSQMGHVGILMKSNFNSYQTIFCNTVVNITSLIGVVFGLCLGQLGEQMQMYILSFVAGNFMYIGADIWKNLMRKSHALQNICEFMSFCVGVGAMYLVMVGQSE